MATVRSWFDAGVKKTSKKTFSSSTSSSKRQTRGNPDSTVSVQNVWRKTLADFEEAQGSGDSRLWTKAALRTSLFAATT